MGVELTWTAGPRHSWLTQRGTTVQRNLETVPADRKRRGNGRRVRA